MEEIKKVIDEEVVELNDEEKKASETISEAEKAFRFIKLKIKEIGDLNDAKAMNDFIESLHPSDRYVVIRDLFTIKETRIMKSATESVDNKLSEYQRFQELKAEATKSFTHDRTNATNHDVDKALTTVYTLLVKMIAVQNERLDTLESIVRLLGKKDGIENADNEESNVQGE